MTGHSFALRPFAPDNPGPGLKITGNSTSLPPVFAILQIFILQKLSYV